MVCLVEDTVDVLVLDLVGLGGGDVDGDEYPLYSSK